MADESAVQVDKRKIRVVVTGASGYVALHCVRQLLEDGYSVRGTVRSLNNAQKVGPLRRMSGAKERLELVEADLVESPQIWPSYTCTKVFSVVEGCDFVLHVASPWPIVADERTIDVAVNGTLTVLRAASASTTVRKVVLTSSCAAINDGHRNDERVFDEESWTDLTAPNSNKADKQKRCPLVDNYARSKTMAERAAWDYWHSLDRKPLEYRIVGRMMHLRSFLAAPKACLGVVDVRDVARVHVRALEDAPGGATNGQRILVTHERPVWMRDMCAWLGAEFRAQGFAVTPLVAPDWAVRLYARAGWDVTSSAVVHRLGPELRFSNRKSVALLGMEYREPRESLLEMAYTLLTHGLVAPPGAAAVASRRFPAKVAHKMRCAAPPCCRATDLR